MKTTEVETFAAHSAAPTRGPAESVGHYVRHTVVRMDFSADRHMKRKPLEPQETNKKRDLEIFPEGKLLPGTL